MPPAVVPPAQRWWRRNLVLLAVVFVLALAAVIGLVSVTAMRTWLPGAARSASRATPAPAREHAAVEQAFRAYRQALASGDLAAMKRCIVPSRRAELDEANAVEMLELVRGLAPSAFEVRAVEVSGNAATITLAATAAGHPATGKAAMVREGGRWLLDKESWEATLELGSESPAGAPLPAQGPVVHIVAIEKLKGGERAAAFEAVAPRFLLPTPPRAPAPYRAGKEHRPQVIATLSGHKQWVDGLAFTPDGRYLVSSSSGDMTLRLWRVEDGAQIDAHATQWRVADLVVSADGSTAYTVDAYEHLLAWPLSDSAIGDAVEFADVPDNERLALAISPNGTLLATAGGIAEVGSLSLWDIAGTSRVRALNVDHIVHDAAFSPDGRLLAAVGRGNQLTVYDLARGEARRYTVKGPARDSEAYGVAFSPDGRFLATAHIDSSVAVFDVPEGTQVHDFFVADASAMDVAFSPDGALFATAQADNTVYLWDVRTAVRLGTLRGHSDTPLVVAFSPAGTMLASAGRDSNIILWR